MDTTLLLSFPLLEDHWLELFVDVFSEPLFLCWPQSQDLKVQLTSYRHILMDFCKVCRLYEHHGQGMTMGTSGYT